jgi:hypothetical protein
MLDYTTTMKACIQIVKSCVSVYYELLKPL